MAFINPNAIASVTKQEFDELKEKVSQMDEELKNIKTNQSNIQSTVNNENSKSYTVRNDINVSNAKLNGAPRVDYFNINKKQETQMIDLSSIFSGGVSMENNVQNVQPEIVQDTPIMQEVNQTQTVPISNIVPNVTYEENIPVQNAIPIGQSIQTQNVIPIGQNTMQEQNNIAQVQMSEQNINNKPYILKKDNIPTIAKTSSGHRTLTMDENKLNYMKQEYYSDFKQLIS